MSNYFKLFACCIVVKGYKRSVICDTQRNNFDFIPNSLTDILQDDIKKYSIDKIKDKYEEFKSTIEEYFNFLIQNEYGFYTREPQNFPEISLTSEVPNSITNAIIDFDKSSNHNFKKIFKELSELLCSAIELRFFDETSIPFLKQLLKQCNESAIRSFQILLPYKMEYSIKEIKKLILEFPRVTSITFHSYSGKATFKQVFNINICYSNEKVDSESCCGQISPDYFVVALNMINESKNFNSCLNKKISIDKNGNIKNCPSSVISFGSHKTNSLKTIIRTPLFKEAWNIKKDQIEVCKDCEFRHICQDCRAYTLDVNNKYSKPSKCKYNPYEATWA